MLNLCLHCGASQVERQQVDESPTPERTETWVPIPHGRLLDLVESTLEGQGLRVVNQAHGLWGDGKRYFGLMEVQNGHSQEDYGLVLGLRNSHDKSFPAGLALGSGVFVCDNLSFSGQVTIARKHTRFIERDLPQLVNRAVGHVTEMRTSLDQRIEAYKAKQLRDRTAHDLLVRAIDAQVLPVTQLPTALAEWREPRHPQFTQHGKSAWRLLNACTEAIKGRNLMALPRRTQALHGILDSACGLAA